MLGFERRFVDALIIDPDPSVRQRVHDWVEISLDAMPQHLRLGVVGESLLLSTWTAVSRSNPAALATSLDRSPLMPLRQYARLFRSLVLFAEQESAPVS